MHIDGYSLYGYLLMCTGPWVLIIIDDYGLHRYL